MTSKTDLTQFEFGDFVSIEQKRYGADNEHYCYRVISSDMKSTAYKPVPFDGANPEYKNGELVPVLIVCNAALTGIDTGFDKVRASDVTLWNGDDNKSTLLSEIKAERAENTALKTEVERLREALGPFSFPDWDRLSHVWDAVQNDNLREWIDLDFIVKARAALNKE